ncbi:Abi family protein [Catellatospora sp. KI3]|uniref:Abi family protein n=1 Tax=Catellatospora sp. KI3 TaxID=3041620 RepID=UPI002482BE02|nr:Abi family protein [Catellatospora sp. KI3]MDI1463351.1 Abi family protein [Catellatospora sp. KI3]
MQAASDHWYEEYLGRERFASFLEAADGDRSQAVALVEWDRDMRGELQKGLGEWEIALRNAYDAVISSWWQGDQHWLLDPQSPVRRPILRDGVDINAKTRHAIAKAVRYARGDTSAGQLIANLTLDFWRYLTVTSREKSLWVPALHRAYNQGASRQKIDHEVNMLYRLRNRVAHHEPIIRQPAQRLAVRLFLSCEEIRPELGDEMLRRHTIVALWEKRPVPWKE